MQIKKQIDGNVNGNVNGTANGSTDCDLNRFSNGDSHSRKDLAVLMLIFGSSANAKAVCLRHNRILQCVPRQKLLGIHNSIRLPTNSMPINNGKCVLPVQHIEPGPPNCR